MGTLPELYVADDKLTFHHQTKRVITHNTKAPQDMLQWEFQKLKENLWTVSSAFMNAETVQNGQKESETRKEAYSLLLKTFVL